MAYWTGTVWQMGEDKKTKKRNQPLLLQAIAGVLAFGLLGHAVTACGSAEEKPAASSSSADAPTRTSPIPMTTPPAPPIAAPAPAPALATEVPADCTPASQDLVDQVNAQLAPSGQMLADTFMKVSPDGYIYVGGNIMKGETKTSSADVWVANDSGLVLYALSGSARYETPSLADGRNLGLSAGDEIGLAVQECSIAAYRVRQ
ncbi:hypothetical protein C6A85_000000102995 [Mycobacterium sp. ITM-2017-0098]|nr:hypothetical protein C6A85_000000102995 [Mycobacterium sp. ITM-2017-0098]